MPYSLILQHPVSAEDAHFAVGAAIIEGAYLMPNFVVISGRSTIGIVLQNRWRGLG